MDKLKELVELLRSSRTTRELVAINEIGNGKIIPFYEGLLNDEFEDDDQAASALYGRKRQFGKYKKLKTYTKKRLIDALFFLDLQLISSSARQTAYFECYKDWAAAKILVSSKARSTGTDLCRQVLHKAQKYEFTELVMTVSNFLRVYYGTLERDLKKFEECNRLFKESKLLWEAENTAEEWYTDLIVRYVNNKKLRKETPAKAKDYYQRLAPLMKKHKSYRLQLCGYLIRMMIFTSVHDYRSTVKICDEAIAFFSKKSYLAKTPIQIFYYQKVVCHLQLKEYEKGQTAIGACLRVLDEGTYNWFKVQEMNLLLATHTRRYQHALKVFRTVTRHRQFKQLPDHEKEMWRIYEAYMYFLSITGNIQPDDDHHHQHTFRLGKFLNETPIYSQDKRGMNIPILIIQILFLIEKKQFDKLLKKMDAIERYSSRYLRKNETLRSNCMIKMLLELPNVSYNLNGVNRRVHKYYEKLKAAPADIAHQNYEIEIIPYEDLWKMALDLLK